MQKCKYIFFFSLILFQGCDINRSVDFILNEPKKYIENDIIFSVNWKNGIPLYYFSYKTMKTIFIINLETDSKIDNVVIESYTIKIPRLGINIKKIEQAKLNMRDISEEPNSVAAKRYWGGKSISVENLFSNIIENEEQLEQFKSINDIYLTLDIFYTIEGVQKKSSLSWSFKPVLKKSNAFLDKWMSV